MITAADPPIFALTGVPIGRTGASATAAETRMDILKSMNRRSVTLALGALVASACRRSTNESSTTRVKPKSVRGDLVFITRDDCVHTPDMFLNLDDALRNLGLALDYEVINLGTLPKTDARIGYPTPTVLYRSHDVFGMPVPTPPYPEPT
jgi:hypothetical protein